MAKVRKTAEARYRSLRKRGQRGTAFRGGEEDSAVVSAVVEVADLEGDEVSGCRRRSSRKARSAPTETAVAVRK